jgi:hypothetical protein
MIVFAEPIVDWATLGKVVAAALIAGIGVTAAFSIAVLGATRSLEMRRSERTLEAGAFAVVGVLGGAVCVAAIVFGIIVMTKK